MRFYIKTVFFSAVFIFSKGIAQEYKQDTLSNGSVISMDERAEKLIENLEEKCKGSSTGTTSVTTGTSGPSTGTSNPTGSPRTTYKKPTNKAELCRQNPKLLGYKILIGVVKSKPEADKLGLSFRSRYPTLKVQVDASLRPNYKIMAGSYFTKESAKSDLNSIRRSFPSANVVQYMIFCTEAK